ncbi:MAG: trehalase-like domain-containing protein [Microthrixaceae bacterium]
MAGRIEDYALIGDSRTVALVCRSGSIDWFCAPRIDSGACFAALLGTEDHGRWSIAPVQEPLSVQRRYEPDTLVLETTFETSDGTVALFDFMVPDSEHPTIHRIVECRGGSVELAMELVVRFDYGSITPWVTSTGDGQRLVAGPEGLRFHSSVPLDAERMRTTARFTITEGTRRAFSLTSFDSAGADPHPLDS